MEALVVAVVKVQLWVEQALLVKETMVARAAVPSVLIMLAAAAAELAQLALLAIQVELAMVAMD
jgi:hypothetical protein